MQKEKHLIQQKRLNAKYKRVTQYNYIARKCDSGLMSYGWTVYVKTRELARGTHDADRLIGIHSADFIKAQV